MNDNNIYFLNQHLKNYILRASINFSILFLIQVLIVGILIGEFNINTLIDIHTEIFFFFFIFVITFFGSIIGMTFAMTYKYFLLRYYMRNKTISIRKEMCSIRKINKIKRFRNLFTSRSIVEIEFNKNDFVLAHKFTSNDTPCQGFLIQTPSLNYFIPNK